LYPNLPKAADTATKSDSKTLDSFTPVPSPLLATKFDPKSLRLSISYWQRKQLVFYYWTSKAKSSLRLFKEGTKISCPFILLPVRS
jgi:hypothetical protein